METKPSVRRSKEALKVSVSLKKRGNAIGAYSIKENYSLNRYHCSSHSHTGFAAMPGPGGFLRGAVLYLCCWKYVTAAQRQTSQSDEERTGGEKNI